MFRLRHFKDKAIAAVQAACSSYIGEPINETLLEVLKTEIKTTLEQLLPKDWEPRVEKLITKDTEGKITCKVILFDPRHKDSHRLVTEIPGSDGVWTPVLTVNSPYDELWNDIRELPGGNKEPRQWQTPLP